MKLSNHSGVPVYTISGSSTARPLPEWLARKRKRSLKQDPEYANRVELLQDFEFEEASQCIRISEDGEWVMSTGTYKPQIHTHYLPHLSLSFARHTDALNTTFQLLSSDYTKSIHLQTDRSLEFHTAGQMHYRTRLPRYGRDLQYDKRSTEALVPSVGVNAEGMGEVFRLNLEMGRYMRSYDIDVGGDDYTSAGAGALQGGIHTGSVNVAAIAEESHNLYAFGTSLGTVEFWDSRSRDKIAVLQTPRDGFIAEGARSEVTALKFHYSGLTIATGSSTGLIHLYDLRSPTPLLKKDQGYGYPIHTLSWLSSSSKTATTPKILSSDKRIIKIWDPETGAPWTAVEPAVDINSVAWYPSSGMILTANEGRQQHAFFIPQLGPAPKWCSFLDNLVEEMAEDPNDPNAYNATSAAGTVYDNYKFLTRPQLRTLNLDHLIGTTSLLRPYMHGFFVAQKLYEEARLIADPFVWEEERAKKVKAKIDAERESRIRGSKKAVAVKVNKKLAEKLLEREEKNERRKAKRALAKAQQAEEEGVDLQKENLDEEEELEAEEPQEGEKPKSSRPDLLTDPRFAKLFQDERFAIDETSFEWKAMHPSGSGEQTNADGTDKPRGLTAAEEEEEERLDLDGSSSSSDEDEYRKPNKLQSRYAKDSDDNDNRISTSSYKRTTAKQKQQRHVQMQASSSSSASRPSRLENRTFGTRVKRIHEKPQKMQGDVKVVGDQEITFQPERKKPRNVRFENDAGNGDEEHGSGDNGRTRRRSDKQRRSASGNVMRKMG